VPYTWTLNVQMGLRIALYNLSFLLVIDDKYKVRCVDNDSEIVEIFVAFPCLSWRLCSTVGRHRPRWV